MDKSKPKRQRILKDTRLKLLERQKHKCAKCRKPLKEGYYEIDHKNPVSEGGSNSIRNLQAICLDCHRRKSIEGSARRAKKKRREKEADPFGVDNLFGTPKRRRGKVVSPLNVDFNLKDITHFNPKKKRRKKKR